MRKEAQLKNNGEYNIHRLNGEEKPIKQQRKEIIELISMRSKKMNWNYAIDLALEWSSSKDKFIFIQTLGGWSLESKGVDAWVNRVENHLEKVLKDICGE